MAVEFKAKGLRWDDSVVILRAANESVLHVDSDKQCCHSLSLSERCLASIMETNKTI